MNIDPRVIASGSYHTVIVDDSDRLWCSGANGSGQLGINNKVNQYQFAPVQGVSAIMAAVGGEHTAIINIKGELMVAGSNSKGQIGTPSNRDCTTFIRPPYKVESPVILVRCGTSTTIGLTDYGEVIMTGINIMALGLGDQCLTFTDCNAALGINNVVNLWVINNNGVESVIMLDDSKKLWFCEANSRPKEIGEGMDVRTVVNVYRGDPYLQLSDQSHIIILDHQRRVYSLDDVANPLFDHVDMLIPSRDGNSACLMIEDQINLLKLDQDGDLEVDPAFDGAKLVGYNGRDIIISTIDDQLLATGYNVTGQLGFEPTNQLSQMTPIIV